MRWTQNINFGVRYTYRHLEPPSEHICSQRFLIFSLFISNKRLSGTEAQLETPSFSISKC